MRKINKVLENDIFSVLGVVRLNSYTIEVLGKVVELIKSGEIKGDKIGNISDLESLLFEIEEQLGEYCSYLDLLEKKLS